MKDIVDKCIEWNKARYDQVLDAELALSLLAEETQELYSATNVVEKLDACGDIVFVAIGVLWKAGMPVSTIKNIVGLDPSEGCCSITKVTPSVMYNTHALFNSWAFTQEVAPEVYEAYVWCHLAICLVISQLSSLDLLDEFGNIVDAICESNNTKEVKGKTDPSVKANINKGSNYVPPTAALEAIIAKYTQIVSIH